MKSLEINYNDTPVKVSKGIICGHHYQSFFSDLPPMEKKQMLRATLITKKPLMENKLSTFTIPPGESTFIGNTNPIRIYQQNFHIEASPRGTFLILVAMQVDDLE